jgi:tRNA/tmRNA/rRNA uracil-C5-methylase (TrmA/RlmC/RlmD family)
MSRSPLTPRHDDLRDMNGVGAASAAGERIRLSVGAPAHGGHCIARHEGRAVFVRHCLPGEEVVAVVTEGGPSDRFWRADAVEILEASPDRVPSAWPEAGPGGVGGGELAHVSLPAQREWKFAVLQEAFERFAKRDFPGVVVAAPGDDERGGLAYRTRVTAVAGEDGRATMRLHRSWQARSLERMPLAVAGVEEALLEARLEPGIRFTVASASGAVLVAPESDSAPTVRERVATPAGEIAFDVRADGFWQVHREAPSLLVREVLARAGEKERVLDLYAGAGLFGLSLALAGADVTLVEFDRRAATDAARTAERHGLGARVLAGDVRRTLRSASLGVMPDAVVLDPPRAGAGAATVDAMVALEPRRIVYVACDPVALARDTALLADRGWDLLEAQAFDLFPMTHHVEAIASFERR